MVVKRIKGYLGGVLVGIVLPMFYLYVLPDSW